MNKKREVIKSLETFIIEKENNNKKRIYKKRKMISIYR